MSSEPNLKFSASYEARSNAVVITGITAAKELAVSMVLPLDAAAQLADQLTVALDQAEGGASS